MTTPISPTDQASQTAEATTTLTVDVPVTLKRAVRMRALETDQTLSQATTEALHAWLVGTTRSNGPST